MIVDRYHFSLSKMRPNMSLTVTMETKPSEHAQSSISFPEPTLPLVSVLVLTKRHVGSGNEIARKYPYELEWKTHLFTSCIQQWNSKWSIFYGEQTLAKKLEKYLWKTSNGKSWQNNDFSRRCKLKIEFRECVYDSKFEHRRPCRILWLFMLAVLLETFYRTIQRNTGKLKSFT